LEKFRSGTNADRTCINKTNAIRTSVVRAIDNLTNVVRKCVNTTNFVGKFANITSCNRPMESEIQQTNVLEHAPIKQRLIKHTIIEKC